MALCTECHRPTDITLRSSDGTLFNTHSVNLEMYSEGFPPSSLTSSSSSRVSETEVEIVQMGETAEVLTLLLQFMHPKKQPDLQKVPIERLMNLAEAAEKFMVYGAMRVCYLTMQLVVKDHPLEVLAYATKFDYPELCDVAGPLTIDMPAANVRKVLNGCALGAWIEYTQSHQSSLRSALISRPNLYTYHSKTDESCHANWDSFHREVIFRAFGRSGNRWRVRCIRECVYLLGGCRWCHEAAMKWEDGIGKGVEEGGRFSAFL